MNTVSDIFTGAGFLLGSVGIYNAYRGNRSLGAFEQRLACLCFTVANATRPVFAQGLQSDENGEVWRGHYFPYAQYPHGHQDCAEGSTVFDSLRSADNEALRKFDFHEDGICKRGESNLIKSLSDAIVVCYANGNMASYPREL
jgi:hypothetical protein